MAQWIPKTAWKASSLNKRYGQQYMTQGYPISQNPDRVLASYAALASQEPCSEAALRQKMQAALKPSRENQVSGAVVIDVRDDPERRLKPLHSSSVVPLHPHDVLSGAARPILPRNPTKAEVYVVSSSEGRAVNTTEALRRWGYESVHFVEYDLVAKVLASLQSE